MSDPEHNSFLNTLPL